MGAFGYSILCGIPLNCFLFEFEFSSALVTKISQICSRPMKKISWNNCMCCISCYLLTLFLIIWIHQELQYKHNKTKHSKPEHMYHGIYGSFLLFFHSDRFKKFSLVKTITNCIVAFTGIIQILFCRRKRFAVYNEHLVLFVTLSSESHSLATFI